MAQFIPAGRTSAIKRGEMVYQLQTEFARLPQPRITTTISSKGQVLRKVEKLIDGEVDSIERMHEVEDVIKVQHMEVSRVIREKGLPTDLAETAGASESKIRSEQMRRLEGVQTVYTVSADGKLVGDPETTREFKKLFKHVLRELPDMLRVFATLPGKRREEGIYEVEPGRILLVSGGSEFFLVLLEPETAYDIISAKINNILS
ncbi:MAG: hypothetical protein GY841_20535 [FCB group bacterium]|nr:hypothetical protein [FCB group bacterium]